jgi:fructose-specific phosphotransferase system IIC component
MNLSWTVMSIVFVTTLVITILSGTYLPKSAGFIGPIVGGLIAGYWVGGNYTDGIVNGGIPVGLAGITYTSRIVAINGYKITVSLNTLIYNGSHVKLLFSLIFASFAFYLVFGIIGGLIGFAIKERKIIKEVLS